MKYNWYAFKIAIVCVIVFILQNIFQITDEFALTGSEIFAKPWTLLTYIFLHGSLEHLFYNMLALVLFGLVLEKIIGDKNFLITFFASGIAAGIGSILFYSSSLGASGAIYGVMGALAVLRPRMTTYVGLGIPMPLVVAVILWSIGDIFGIFFPSDNIAYAAHIFGLVFGLAYGFYLRKYYREDAKSKTRSYIKEEEFRKWEDGWLSHSYL